MERVKTSKGWKKHLVAEAGFNISWGAVIAGVVTFFASLATLSLIGSAIGFGVVEPTSNDPFSGVGTGLLIWTVVMVVLSFMAAGFVAGMAARRVGMLHGFLTWATSVILLIVMLSYVATSALSAVGSLFGSAFSLVGEGASAAASGVETVISEGVDSITGTMEDVDTQELQTQVEDILADTDVPELQPEYLSNELDEARNEVTEAGKDLLTDPENSEEILSSLAESLQSRAEAIGNAADRDAIAEAVSSNTDLTEEEAREATDNIYNGLQSASESAQDLINQAADGIEEAQQQIDQAIEDARVAAEDAANATSKASIWAFIALVLGLILTTISGIWGSNFVGNRAEEIM